MIDPLRVTDFDRSQEGLEVFWIFCVVVAGKNADSMAEAVRRLLGGRPPGQRPLAYLASLGPRLHDALVASRTGQYRRIARALAESFDLDLAGAALERLEQVHGVGPKTARYFVLHTRARARVAVLDTHLLKWLKRRGLPAVPPHTPGSRKRYLELESRAILAMERAFPNMTLAQADLHIWATTSGRTAP
ncbi:MAG: hypothetical protein ABR915_20740 [Thermoguttaceae bacterium]|jgi:3-methyladenine DNA glycosylase/8-oxoguanine DNA glycosylase